MAPTHLNDVHCRTGIQAAGRLILQQHIIVKRLACREARPARKLVWYVKQGGSLTMKSREGMVTSSHPMLTRLRCPPLHNGRNRGQHACQVAAVLHTPHPTPPPRLRRWQVTHVQCMATAMPG
jgi:hypothetical protein